MIVHQDARQLLVPYWHQIRAKAYGMERAETVFRVITPKTAGSRALEAAEMIKLTNNAYTRGQW